MALTSALFTGLSGLDVNQTKLNVVGNNIANVNTTAFKASTVLFKPQFYVTDTGGTAPDSSFGGTNPSQRGLGATVASIEKDFSTGAIQSTGKDTDMAIDGSGFFVVKSDQQQYTRDGSFTLNSANQLVTSSGDFVEGFGVDNNFNITSGQLTNLTIPLGQKTIAKASTTASLKGNLNSGGNVAAGASILNSQALVLIGGGAPAANTPLTSVADAANPTVPLISAGQTLTLNGQKGGKDQPTDSLTVTAATTIGDFENFMNQGLGIDVAATPTSPTIPQPGATAAAIPGDAAGDFRMIVAGNTGTANSLSLAGAGLTIAGGGSPFTFGDGQDAAGNKSDPSGESTSTAFTAFDSLGTPVNVDVTTVLESKSNAGTTWRYYATSADNQGGNGIFVGSGTLSFDNSGHLTTTNGNSITIDRAGTGAQPALTLNLDFSGVTGLDSDTSNVLPSNVDGEALGTLTSFTVGENGVISGAFTNGLTKPIGQIAIATFANPQGLIDNGGNMYSAGADSGAASIAAPQTLGAGSIRSGALEASNVDISNEFINMIIASTGFSAASRVITTSNQLLTDLLNSNR